MSSFCKAAAVLFSFAVGQACAQSQEVPAPASSLTASFTVASQYVSRGVRQGWGKPALQGGVDFAHPNGWSAGTWASTVNERFIEKASVEWDLYGGYTRTVGEGSVSALLYYYVYPGAIITSTGTKFNYGELSLGATWRAFYAKANITYTRDFFGITNARGTIYWDVGANYPLADDWTLNLHAGMAQLSGTGNDFWDWRDWKAGVTRVLAPGWSAVLAYTRAHGKTDAYSRYISAVSDGSGKPLMSNAQAGTLVLAVTRSF
jgi:uncharacterized protein (TIGR02001 family)